MVIASGYGLKVYVAAGHLVVHQGIGRGRETLRFNRATSRLRRLVVTGHTGYVTLEALRWIRDVGAAFLQIDEDGSLSPSAPPTDSTNRSSDGLRSSRPKRSSAGAP
jgi:hypothetical protein